MSIEVIKHGKETFKVICSKCGCEFTYQLEDLKSVPLQSNFPIVKCPECHLNIALNREDEAVKLRHKFWELGA